MSFFPISQRSLRLSPGLLAVASILLMIRTHVSQPISAAEAVKRAESYFAAHPGSPSATRRPALIPRSGTWVAIIGEDIQHSVVGLGGTVEAALRAFDVQYLAAHPSSARNRAV